MRARIYIYIYIYIYIHIYIYILWIIRYVHDHSNYVQTLSF